MDKKRLTRIVEEEEGNNMINQVQNTDEVEQEDPESAIRVDDEDTSEAEEEEKKVEVQEDQQAPKPDLSALKKKLLNKLDAFKLDDEPLPISTRIISEEQMLKNKFKNMERQEEQRERLQQQALERK